MNQDTFRSWFYKCKITHMGMYPVAAASWDYQQEKIDAMQMSLNSWTSLVQKLYEKAQDSRDEIKVLKREVKDLKKWNQGTIELLNLEEF